MAGSSSRDFTVNIQADQTQADAAFRQFAGTVTGLAGKVSAAWGAINLGQLLGDGLQTGLDIDNAKNLLQTQLGDVGDRAGEAGAVAGRLWRSGFTENLEQANEAVRAVAQNLGDVDQVGAAAFEQTARQAQALATAMGEDVQKVTAAAESMVRSGMAKDATEAFDVLATGMQTGANKAEDLLDTFVEYPVQFAKLGISGQMALGLINQGLAAGARNADIVADAIKEFTIRAQEAMVTPIDPAKVEAANAGVQASYRDAASAAAAAADTIKAAEDRLAGAQRDAKSAQESLTRARRDAKQALEDLADQVIGAELGQRGAEMAVKRAQEALDAALTKTGKDYNPLDVEEAQLRLDQARFNLKEQKESLKDLRAEKAKADKEGVDGAENVRAAQDKVRESDQALRDSQAEVRQARADAAASAAESAAKIAEAQANLAAATQAQFTPMGAAYNKLGLDGRQIGADLAAGGSRAVGALQTVTDALRGVDDPIARAQIGVQIFGTKWEDMQDSILALNPKTAAASAQFAGMGQSIGQVVSVLGDSLQAKVNATNADLAETGSTILGLPGAEKFLAYSDAFNSVAGVVGPVVAGLASIRTAQVIGSAAAAEGTVANVGFAASLWAASAPILAVIAGLALLAGGAYLVYRNWDKIAAGFQATKDWVADHWQDIGLLILGPFPWAVRQIVKHWDTIKDKGGDALGWIGGKLAAFGGILVEPFVRSGRIISGWWGSMKGWATDGWRWISGRAAAIGDAFLTIPKKIGDLATSLGNGLMTVVRTIANAIAWLWNNSVGSLSVSLPGWLGGGSFSMPKINVPTAPAPAATAPRPPAAAPARPAGSSARTVTVVAPVSIDGRVVGRSVNTVNLEDRF